MDHTIERELTIRTLRHYKLKVTNSRLVVLQILSRSTHPMTVKDMGKVALKLSFSITEASIYIILRTFLGCGLVNKSSAERARQRCS